MSSSRRRRNRKNKSTSNKNAKATSTVDNSNDAVVVAEKPNLEPKHETQKADTPPPEQTHSTRVTEAIENIERWMAQANSSTDSSSPTLTQWQQNIEQSMKKSSRALAAEFKKLTESFDLQIESLRDSIALQLEQLAASQVPSESNETLTPTKAEEKVTDLGNDWERRKREMYAEYGEEYPTNDTTQPETSPESVDTEEDDLASLQESLHDSIESIDEVQAEEIEDLRAQLTEKLREAEVELSINRAKLDQRRAALDQRQTELERREKSLDSKYSQVNGKPQKPGVLDRLTRHLGVRKQADSL